MASDGTLVRGEGDVVGLVVESSRPPVTSRGPHFAREHRFHPETAKMGTVLDQRTFTKEQFEGRLSVRAYGIIASSDSSGVKLLR